VEALFSAFQPKFLFLFNLIFNILYYNPNLKYSCIGVRLNNPEEPHFMSYVHMVDDHVCTLSSLHGASGQ